MEPSINNPDSLRGNSVRESGNGAARPHGTGRAGETGCGAAIEVSLRFTGEKIAVARVTGAGPDEAIDVAARLAALIEGKSWRRAASISPQQLASGTKIASAVDPDGSPTKKTPRKTGTDWQLPGATIRQRSREMVAAGFAIEALQRAFEDALANGSFPVAASIDPETILVAMSGGVDSSVACLLEKQQGRRVIGLTMRLWSDPDCAADDGSSCCSPLSIRDARAVCHQLGLPHLTVDLAAQFEADVVEPFVRAYLAGMTPNPCTTCNGVFRFPALARLAECLGAGRIATGHYVRVGGVSGSVPGQNHTTGQYPGVDRRPGSLRLARGADPDKDQSYMLWALEPRLLERLDFPLANMTKEETRIRARQASLQTHSRPESQDICFIPDGDHRRFLRARTKTAPGPGAIIDTTGHVIGRHTGFTDYTIGQRHGLGGGASEPLFVLDIKPDENVVVAGAHEELAIKSIIISDVNTFVPLDELRNIDGLSLQARYRSPAVAACVKPQPGGSLLAETASPLFGVAPGQSAVLYLKDEVVAGGVIVSTY